MQTQTSSFPLALLSQDRDKIVDEVLTRTLESLHTAAEFETAVRDSLFWEKKRLVKRTHASRDTIDQAFWKKIGGDILENRSDYRTMLSSIVRHHSEEIVGNFDRRVYTLATIVVPRIFTWLLRAVSLRSLRSILPGRMDLRDRIHLEGKIDELRALSQKGTILLVPTHFSNLDSILIGWALYEIGLPPFCYGAGLNLFTNPLIGFFMNNLGAYKVDRRKRHELYKNILKNYSATILERGCHSLFFPSGGRSRSGSIQNKLKLGLLGTGLEAYVNNLMRGKAKPNVYIVPCTISYHFTLEGSTLIDDFLAEQGKSRYIIEDDESSKPKTVAQFFYKFFTASSKIYLNFGRALDPFGHLVDEEGNSLSDRGTFLDPVNFVRSNGMIQHDTQRDQEYTKHLGQRITDRYYKENIALTSHFVAYTYFEYLRQKHGSGKDLFKLLRMGEEKTAVPFNEYAKFATPLLEKIHNMHDRGDILLEPALRSNNLQNILEAAIRNIGVYHAKRPIKLEKEDSLICEDLKLLYYYHNRMEGYKLYEREHDIRS